jgi:hypothetical protein
MGFLASGFSRGIVEACSLFICHFERKREIFPSALSGKIVQDKPR